MHWIRRSVGCRVASHRAASRRLASLRVTRARCHRGSIYRVRQSAKADLSSSLGLPIYLPTYLSIYPSAALTGRRAYQRADHPLCLPLYFPAREARARATHAPIETVTVSRYTLRYTQGGGKIS